MADTTKKKPFFGIEAGVDLADIVVREISPEFSRSSIVVTLTTDTPKGTVLEKTGETWAVASNYTGLLGILTDDVAGRSGAQEVGVVDADAVLSADALNIPSEKLETATATFAAQRVKLI